VLFNITHFYLQVIYAICYVDVSSNKQLKQDMHTLMAKLKQQQQSSSAVSSSLCSVLIAELYVFTHFYASDNVLQHYVFGLFVSLCIPYVDNTVS